MSLCAGDPEFVSADKFQSPSSDGRRRISAGQEVASPRRWFVSTADKFPADKLLLTNSVTDCDGGGGYG